MKSDLFADMPPPGMTLEDAQKRKEHLLDRLAYTEHNIIHGHTLSTGEMYNLKAERYEINKELNVVGHWIEEIL